MLESQVAGNPFLINRDRIPEMNKQVARLVKAGHFEAIHADQLWMAQFALSGQTETPRRAKLVLDQHNALFLIPYRMAADNRNPLLAGTLMREARRMARYETMTVSAFDHTVWVTKEDLQAVEQNPFKYPIHQSCNTVIPICIDPETIPIVPLNQRTKDILFVGGMHWPPNADGVNWFVEHIFPEIHHHHPTTQFVAIGKNPPAVLQQAPSVIAPGYVVDPAQYWSSCRVFVVPLKSAGGMRVKILDAWAHGVPVVSTSIGAEGINYQDGENILIADSSDEFANAVQRVIEDHELARKLAYGGRQVVLNTYNWRKAYHIWNGIYGDN
jgi:glycosyltransferase involved in cell wall biosynthesis